MQEPASSDGLSNTALQAGLLDYCQSPGKYQVGLRQPQLLFASVREILQMAIGREEQAGSTSEAASLRDAARFFVRTALLFPGADHYALLGVERTADIADLKDRYRLMMRLLHPDFSGPSAGSWPADSAVRVNRAYDTLSSAVQRRLYDESLVIPVHASGPVSNAELRRPRPAAVRSDGDMRQSHFKLLAVVCALAGAGLVALIVSATGSPESVQLVQRARVAPEPAPSTTKDSAPAPLASTVARLQEALAQLAPSVTPAPRASQPPARRMETTKPPVVEPPPRPAQALRPTPQPIETRAALLSPSIIPSIEPKPEVMLAAVPVATPPATPAPVATLVAAASAPAASVLAVAAPRAAPKPGPTLQEAQPLLSQLLQVMESGRGERILNLLDAEARTKPSAQSLSRQYDSIVDGARPVRVSHVEFKAEPGDGRLFVVGYFRVMAGEQTIGSLGRKMMLRAEFASREGTVVITGLSGGPVN